MPEALIREARLRPESAGFYPGIEAGAWLPAASLARLVLDKELYRNVPGAHLGGRPLPDEYFDFRGPSRPPEERPAGRSRETDVSVAEAERELRSEAERLAGRVDAAEERLREAEERLRDRANDPERFREG
jgi:hypothetical protein